MKRLEISIDKLVEQYKLGYSTKYLSQFYNCSTTTIERRLKEANCEIDYNYRKYTLNEKFFDIIDTEDKAYWLGVMLTDGNLSKKLIKLSFNRSDEGHLKKFLKSISSSHPIKYQETKAYVSIGNKHMRENLIYKGVLANDRKVFKVPVDLERHYWRGAIDGSTTEFEINSIGLLGSKETCESFRFFCQKNVNTQASIKYQENNIWSYKINGNLAYNLTKILYDKSSIYLERKYQKYLKWSNLCENKPLYPRVVKFFKSIFSNIDLSIKKCKLNKSLEGICCYEDGKYVIKINENLNDSEAVNCLLHELSHIETMLKQKDPHGSAFGIAYSRIYKLYEAEFTG